MTKARDIASAAPAPSTVSATEIGYLDGVSSAIQTQLNAKQAVVSGVNDTEIGYLDGVTSAIQTQLDAKTAKSTLSTTGDIYYASSANTPARLGIGSTGNVLTVASGIPSWAAPAGSSGPAFLAYRSSNTSTVNGVWTKTPFNAESFDTDNCFDSTTNYRFTPNKSGYYSINTQVLLSISPVKWAQMRLYFNGNIVRTTINDSQDSTQAMKMSTLIYMNGSSDYLEVYYYIEGTGTVNGDSTIIGTWFDGVWIRS